MTFRSTIRPLLWGAALSLAAFAPAAQARHYQVLHSFNGSDGESPNGNLVLDAAGNLYGTTIGGGSSGDGTIFKISPAGDFTSLYSFTGGSDGRFPETGLSLDPATGDLYGTDGDDAAQGYGCVFKYTAAGQLVVLHAFDRETDGMSPDATLTTDGQGNFYGTTNVEGSTGSGAIFEIAANGGYQVLSGFKGAVGGEPQGRLVLHGSDLYGTTTVGGSGSGTVFQFDLGGTFTALWTPGFGTGLESGLARDRKGDLYGAYTNEPNGFIFEVTPHGRTRTLYTFTGGSDGRFPIGDMLLTEEHHMLYGATYRGGAKGDNGTIYSLDRKGNFTLLHGFAGAPNDGVAPTGGLVRKNAELYGTTTQGGSSNMGIVFAVSTK